ncbi:MAG: hypothetical protein Tsb009_24610 [Planctomycetaceae bacterium]
MEKDFQRLIETTAKSDQVFRGLKGIDRAVLYLTAAHTGLRARELASLCVDDVALETEPPTMTVKAGYSKRRRRDVQPIRADIADVLRRWMEENGYDKHDRQLWSGTWYEDAAEMLRGDLEDADIEYTDVSGRVFDFHALRHQFISNLAGAGVHPKTAQLLARHSNITLTMDRYTHTDVAEAATALQHLPRVELALTQPTEKQKVGLLTLMLTQKSGITCPTVLSGGQQDTRMELNIQKENPLKTRGFSPFGTNCPNLEKRGRRDLNPQPPDRQSGTLTN